MPIEIFYEHTTWPPNFGDYENKLILHHDNWDDFTYMTTFHMNYCDKSRQAHEIGIIKIAHIEQSDSPDINICTKEFLSLNVEQLSDNFCSLGQTLEFYAKLKFYFPNEYMDILKRFNDMATIKEIKEKFIDYEGVRYSLLRESSAVKALNEAWKVLHNLKIEQNLSFNYKYSPPYSKEGTSIKFNFEIFQHLSNRINIIVGKNGVGKTQFLEALTKTLTGEDVKGGKNYFESERPSVDKVMSISYSAFDSFRKPIKSSLCSYVYCGIQSEDGALSIEELEKNFKHARQLIKDRDREEIWTEIMKELLEDEHKDIWQHLNKNVGEEKHWSSGQNILICTMTEVISKIENGSIILFDEPEIHLHPNAMSNVMRMFYKLLEEFNSYAILSTHSPIILQEIPSKYVHILDRASNVLSIRKPTIECFGNNISEITAQVFDVSTRESNFKPKLKELSRKMTYEEVLDLFENNLSLGAMMFLKACYEP